MKILITAGPTREMIDPIRFISNRSSGKMGYAVAAAAAKKGHDVVLISGPVSIDPPENVKLLKVISAADMLDAVKANLEWCDVLVMAAAVADWRPTQVVDQKIKKGPDSMAMNLECTADILASVKNLKGDRFFVGFAAETGDPLSEAKRKLNEKGLDLVVANDVSREDSGFEVDTNKVFFVGKDDTVEDLPLMSKLEVGEKIVDWIECRILNNETHPGFG